MRASKTARNGHGLERSSVLVEGRLVTGGVGLAVAPATGSATGAGVAVGATVALGAGVGVAVAGAGVTDGAAAVTTELTVARHVTSEPPPFADPLH